jgi:hypothetical protein
MYELEASSFYIVTRELRNLLAILNPAAANEIPQEGRDLIGEPLKGLIHHLEPLRANVAWTKTNRMLQNLQTIKEMTYQHAREQLADIDSCLQDELLYRKVFVIDPNNARYFDTLQMFGSKISIGFPSVLYEIDEAGKCFALGRSTACVFHLMRTMEVGIRVVARCLGVPDPLKGDRNWGSVLKGIKTAMGTRDGQMPASTWTVAGDKEFFEGV